MVITISHKGYIKRNHLDEYRSLARGGVGSRGASAKDGDFTEHLFIANTHNYLLIFTESGRMYWLKVYEIPEASKAAKGRAIQNLINIPSTDGVRAVINVKDLDDPDYINNAYIVMCTVNGTIKKTVLEAFSRPRGTGINAISINDNDRLLYVYLTDVKSEIVLAVRSGRAIRFPEDEVRPMGRNAAGVRGISLDNDEDRVVGMVCLNGTDETLLVVSENGYGKRSNIDEYRITRRGGKGVKTLNVTSKTGKLVAIKKVSDQNDLMIINKSGIMIRTPVSELRVMGRATQGVRLIRLNDNDAITSVTKVDIESDIEEEVNNSSTEESAPEE